MTFRADKIYRLFSPRGSELGAFARVEDAKRAAKEHDYGPHPPHRWAREEARRGVGGSFAVTYYEQQAGYVIRVEDHAARRNPEPGAYHVSVLPPKLKLWPHLRDVVVFDEPSKSHALVRVHDLKVDPQVMLVGMKIVLQSEDARGRWVNLVEYEYESCRKGWKSTLL